MKINETKSLEKLLATAIEFREYLFVSHYFCIFKKKKRRIRKQIVINNNVIINLHKSLCYGK